MKPFYLKGKVTLVGTNNIIVESNQNGYPFEVIDSSKFQEGSAITLYVHEFTYEEKYSLYGFLQQEELRIFELLLDCKGVGPKTALSLIRKLSIEKLKTYIVECNVDALVSLGEVGPMTATSIVQLLKPKIKKEGVQPRSKTILNVIKASKSLGFKACDVEPIIDGISNTNIEEGELLKIVLNQLRRKEI